MKATTFKKALFLTSMRRNKKEDPMKNKTAFKAILALSVEKVIGQVDFCETFGTIAVDESSERYREKSVLAPRTTAVVSKRPKVAKQALNL